jgi:hypothetical protein
MNVSVSDIQQLKKNPVFADGLGVWLMDSIGAHVSQSNFGCWAKTESPLLFSQRIPLLYSRPLISFFGVMKNNKDLFTKEPEFALVQG